MKLHVSQKGNASLVLIIILITLGAAIFFRSSALKNSSPIADTNNEKEQILYDIVGHGVRCDIKDEKGVVTNNNCKVDVIKGDYAKGTMPMAYWMAVKKNNRWGVAIVGNGIPNCEEVDKFSIPKEIYGSCIEKSGELRKS